MDVHPQLTPGGQSAAPTGGTATSPHELDALSRTALRLLLLIEAQAKSRAKALSNEDYAATLEVNTSKVVEAFRALQRRALLRCRTNGTRGRIIEALRFGLATAPSERETRAAPRPERRKRPCITCRTPFLSEGIGHRMCGDCR